MNDSRFTRWLKSTRSDVNGGCVEVATGWRKSSRSAANGDCVEVAGWRKSTYSGTSQNCVEVSASEPIVGVRDTKQHGEGPVLEFPGAVWRAFLADLRTEQFGC